MSWSAKSSVYSVTRAVNGGGSDGLGFPFKSVVLQEDGMPKYMRKEMIGIIQRRGAAKRFDEGPSIVASSTYLSVCGISQG